MNGHMPEQFAAAAASIASAGAGAGGIPTRRQGFTLIELLVVIGTIGCLASLLSPALSRTKAAAESVVCKSNLRQHALALSTDLSDSGGNYPRAYDSLTPSGDLPSCPTAGRFSRSERSKFYGYRYNYEGTGSRISRYGQNTTVHFLGLGGSETMLSAPGSPTGRLVEMPLPESSVRRPSDMIAFTHVAQYGSGCSGVPPVGFGWPGVPGIPSPNGPLHQEGENAAFCDGHVESENSDGIPQWSTDGEHHYFKPDAVHARRWNHDNQPHFETWPEL